MEVKMAENDKKLILYLTKTKLKSGNVVLGDNPKANNIKEVSWTPEALPEILEKIKKQYNVNSARVIFGDLISYVVELEIPKDVENKRAFIGMKVAETIPEILENTDWDFIETGGEGNFRKVKVFAPHKDFLTHLLSAAEKSELKVEAIEPESLAALRHKDPMIGLALKTDILGKDEEVLNIIPQESIKEEIKQVEDHSERKKINFKLFGLILFILIVLAGLIYGGIMVAGGSLKQSPFGTNSPTPTSVLPTPVPTLIQEEITKETIKINILNGSGKVGLAGTTKTYLEELGYRSIETGNADSYSYPQTTISLKEEAGNLQEQLIKDLSEKFSIASSEATFEEDSLFDVVIVLGKK